MNTVLLFDREPLPLPPPPLPFVYDDGGRAEAGFRGDTGDCVCRAIAIAMQLDYREVYAEISRRNSLIGKARSARNGLPKKMVRRLILNLGFDWVPTMQVGVGTTVHLREGELPSKGRLIVQVSRHLCAVIDGVVHDTYDPSREGVRCVYGYYLEGR